MKVITVIPVYLELEALHPFELISLKQYLTVLKKHPVYLIGPEHLNWEAYSNLFSEYEVPFQNKIFHGRFFKDIGGYSRLLLSPKFYRSFASYEYLFIYQLDAFVFSDELERWCNKGYDYLGAPWFENFSDVEGEGNFMGVGNGGFSLRNIESHIRVLNTFTFVTGPSENFKQRFQEKKTDGSVLRNIGGMMLDYTTRNNTHWLLNNYKGHEDQFWGLTAAKKFNWFKVPSYEEAAAFAFEMQPHRLFRLNNNQLPFGCHAWWKYDLEFWRPHIEKFNYKLKIEKV